MVVFGFSSGSKVEARLTDARIQFLLFTVVVSLVALSRIRPATDARFRSLQALTVLPTAALPLATGGDDMPVVALMLLGLVALQRRRPVLAGLALGAASTLKFTAWPRGGPGRSSRPATARRRAVGRYVLAVAASSSRSSSRWRSTTRRPSSTTSSGSRSGWPGWPRRRPARSPGTSWCRPSRRIHRPYVVVVGVLGLAVLARDLCRHPPRDAAAVASLTGWVMLVAILLAPATRVGLPAVPDQPVPVGVDVPGVRGPGRTRNRRPEDGGADDRSVAVGRSRTVRRSTGSCRPAWWGRRRRPSPSRSRRHCPAWPGPRRSPDTLRGGARVDHLPAQCLEDPDVRPRTWSWARWLVEVHRPVELGGVLVGVDDTGDRRLGGDTEVPDDVGRRLIVADDGVELGGGRGDVDHGAVGQRHVPEGERGVRPAAQRRGHHAAEEDDHGQSEDDEGRAP